MVDTDRLVRLLGRPELSWLVDRIRDRMARGRPLTGVLTLSAPRQAQREAVERLLGRAPRGGRSLTVRLDALDGVLRHSGISPQGLAAAVVALTGPVRPLAEEREAEDREWEEAYAPLAALGPAYTDWIRRIRRDGLVRRLARSPGTAGPLLRDTARVLRALPAAPPTSLAAFAARVLGRSHALDDGTPLATLVLSAIRALGGIPDGTGAEWRREAWASAGLLKDDLSSTVLVLNVRGTPVLDAMADAGEPAVLTLRHLARHLTGPDLGLGLGPTEGARATGGVQVPEDVRVTDGVPVTADVYVCENPAVLSAAADAYGPACPPLVCLQGQPSAAALALLRHLSHGGVHGGSHRGATLHYHGDFDWGGLRIATALRRAVPWTPWRYGATDYRAAAAATPGPDRLSGPPAESAWDPALAAALTELGVRVEEESVLDELLGDLGRPTTRP
ncbi:TIGR02679 domain-containing protein [Streptomyces hebeiensis]